MTTQDKIKTLSEALQACITEPGAYATVRNRHDPKQHRLSVINEIAKGALAATVESK